MKICVLTGSPKGKNSITYQTVRYLEKRFPQDEFAALHVGQGIRGAERDLAPFISAMREADLILFCYPVYTFIAPWPLHRFIELLKASGADLRGKLCAQLTTSKHFYDVTAHQYIIDNAQDMGMRYLGGLSADMDDILTSQGQHDADTFWELVHFRAENGIFAPDQRIAPKPAAPYRAQENAEDAQEKCPGAQAVIVANLTEGDEDLAAMIEDFRRLYPHETRIVNLNEFPFAGGCLGCFNCAVSGKCIHKDGFDRYLREEIQSGSAIVYAFRISDHSMGARMKLYDDRQFCNGHRTVTAGMPMGYLIRGDLSAEPNLRTIIDGRANVGGNFLAGVATDEAGVRALARELDFAVTRHVTQPANFLGVGGMKIFRDLIYLMQGMMKADHRFYKAHGLYDFPQKQHGTILKMRLVGLLISVPKLQAKLGGKMTEGMLAPYEKMLNQVKQERG